jgi:hypothetical protein
MIARSHVLSKGTYLSQANLICRTVLLSTKYEKRFDVSFREKNIPTSDFLLRKI